MPTPQPHATTRPGHRAQAPVQFPQLTLPKLELAFKDGSRLWLHQVKPDVLVRRVTDDTGAQLAAQVNLRDIDATLDAELAAVTSTDRPAVIFFTLRRHFASAADFMAHVVATGVAH